jgi:hypothetical protein
MWSGRVSQVHGSLIAGRSAYSVEFRMLSARSLKQPSLHYPDWYVRLNRCGDHYRKHQKRFSKTLARTGRAPVDFGDDFESEPKSITWRHGRPQTDCCQHLDNNSGSRNKKQQGSKLLSSSSSQPNSCRRTVGSTLPELQRENHL